MIKDGTGLKELETTPPFPVAQERKNFPRTRILCDASVSPHAIWVRVLHSVWIRQGLLQPLLYYALTTGVVLFGVGLGYGLLGPGQPSGKASGYLGSLIMWDGGWYRSILTSGYSYTPGQQSSVAFLPAYPLLARLLSKLVAVSPDWSLVLVSHICLAATFIVLAAYTRLRYPHSPAVLAETVLLCLGIVPTTFYFRLAHSESLFLFLSVLVFYTMEKRWPAPLIAVLVGAASAARIPGLCLLVPFVAYLWRRSADAPSLCRQLVYLGPLACWGFGAWTFYQWIEFGDPVACLRAHQAWFLRPPIHGMNKLYALVTLEPIRAVFDPASPGHWKHFSLYQNVVFSPAAANPCYFLGTAALLILGACRRWLNSTEVIWGSLLLLIAYWGRGYELCMLSTGRFTSVVFPAYLVLGHLIHRLPRVLAIGFQLLSAILLVIHTGMFVAGYLF